MATSILSGAISAGGPLGVIASMITPAFLILAAANLVGSTLARLTRTVDSARATMERKRKLVQAGDSEGAAEENQMLARYRTRAILVEAALACFYSAIGLFVATSLAIAIAESTHHAQAYLPVWLTIAGAFLLFAGSMLLLAEATIATRMLQTEIADALD
jgi:Protein of unknown function (DUF2721)